MIENINENCNEILKYFIRLTGLTAIELKIYFFLVVEPVIFIWLICRISYLKYQITESKHLK